MSIHRKIIAASILGLSSFTLAISLANSFTSVIVANEQQYTLTLDSSNKITSSSVDEVEIETDLGGSFVTFAYANVDVSSSGHCVINTNGTIKNKDHILSISKIAASYSGGELQYRFSSDNVNWSSFSSLTSGINVDLSSRPYFIEFKAINSSIDLTSIKYTYSCTEIGPIDNHVTSYNNYYYDLVSWSDGEDLKEQLYNIIHSGTYTALKYDGNYESNKDADKSLNDFEYLDVIYSSTDVFNTRTNIGWQREHAWPASLMTGQTTTTAVKTLGRATDFHNLWASNSSGNSSRGNKNYGIADVTNPNYKDFGGYTYDPQTFEPSNEDKGLVARSIFYMATMYSKDEENGYKALNITEEAVTYNSSDESTYFRVGNLSALLSWNDIPVNIHEAQHNESVYSYTYSGTNTAQGNRNPYIDFPELVDYVFGSKKNQSGYLKDLTPTCDVVNFEEHYALAYAKRDYKLGETLTSSDYQVVKVNSDLTTEEVSATNSLNNHTFVLGDGDSITATISIDTFTYSYEISLNPMGNCSYIAQMDKGWTSADKNGSDDSNNYVDTTSGEVTWRFYYEAKKGITSRQIIADNKNGGFKMGSGTYAVTKVIITTVNEYTVDAAYIKAFASNTDSSFNLKIMVGDDILLNSATVTYNNQTPAVYGSTSSTPLTGQVSFILTGSNAINLQSIAFNKVIA